MNILLPAPVLGFVVSTRAALAFGIGLLVADRIPRDRRRQLGATLVAIGAATTIPALRSIRRRRVQPDWPQTHSLAEL
jgi:hypothetical protein